MSRYSVKRNGMRYFAIADEPFYSHVGYHIKREHRGWDGRSTGPGGRGTALRDNAWMFNVYDVGRGKRYGPVESFKTLREAKAFCEANPRGVTAVTTSRKEGGT